ncbi:hypothetical protein OH720_18290 [Pseudomonas sp. WJP1]|uniref:hypothetical protein n=1 Tax=Pseudomonas sp. WJP1 TaxID=2986947 RepID=UPI00234A73C2|nr:hypothetical protein [Pseudomonas sp. WJP1]WCM48961.1 hypothetical protein OH720_18290 [Pseudomonas sp. WJP1]
MVKAIEGRCRVVWVLVLLAVGGCSSYGDRDKEPVASTYEEVKNASAHLIPDYDANCSKANRPLKWELWMACRHAAAKIADSLILAGRYADAQKYINDSFAFFKGDPDNVREDSACRKEVFLFDEFGKDGASVALDTNQVLFLVDEHIDKKVSKERVVLAYLCAQEIMLGEPQESVVVVKEAGNKRYITPPEFARFKSRSRFLDDISKYGGTLDRKEAERFFSDLIGPMEKASTAAYRKNENDEDRSGTADDYVLFTNAFEYAYKEGFSEPYLKYLQYRKEDAANLAGAK